MNFEETNNVVSLRDIKNSRAGALEIQKTEALEWLDDEKVQIGAQVLSNFNIHADHVVLKMKNDMERLERARAEGRNAAPDNIAESYDMDSAPDIQVNAPEAQGNPNSADALNLDVQAGSILEISEMDAPVVAAMPQGGISVSPDSLSDATLTGNNAGVNSGNAQAGANSLDSSGNALGAQGAMDSNSVAADVIQSSMNTNVPVGCGCPSCFGPQNIGDGESSGPMGFGVGGAELSGDISNSGALLGAVWGSGAGAPITITYSFVGEVPSYYGGSVNGISSSSFAAFTGSMIAAMQQILQQIEDFTNIDFVETSGVGDITFGTLNMQSGLGGFAWLPESGTDFDGDVWISNNPDNGFGADFNNVTPGSIAWLILAHELGHALGLIHSGPPASGHAGLDISGRETVMAYDFSGLGNSGDIFLSTMGLFDIAALQSGYGEDRDTTAGDDTYQVDGSISVSIWDGDGVDTLDASGTSEDAVINLGDFEISSVGGLIDNISIAANTLIENAKGGSGNDTFYGNYADNRIEGGAGNDVVYFDASGYAGDLDGESEAEHLLRYEQGNDTFIGGEGNDTVYLQYGLHDFNFFQEGDTLYFQLKEGVAEFDVDGETQSIQWVYEFTGVENFNFLNYITDADGGGGGFTLQELLDFDVSGVNFQNGVPTKPANPLIDMNEPEWVAPESSGGDDEGGNCGGGCGGSCGGSDEGDEDSGNKTGNPGDLVEGFWDLSTITFSFGQTGEFSDALKDAARLIFASLETFLGVEFQEVGSGGNLNLYTTELGGGPNGGVMGLAQLPSMGQTSGSVFVTIDDLFQNFSDVEPGSNVYGILAHEIGHGLGLGHTFSSGFTGDWNTQVGSLLSYNWTQWGQPPLTEGEYDSNAYIAGGYRDLDVAALQTVYGANEEHNVDDDVYVLGASVDAGDFSVEDGVLWLAGANFASGALWDAGGNDTLDATAIDADVIIRLEDGEYSSLDASQAKNFVIAYDTIIENVNTGSGNDIIHGNDVDNIINSGAGNDSIYAGVGNDTIDGGMGEDTLFFALSQSSYKFYNGPNGSILIEQISGSDIQWVVTALSVEKFNFAGTEVAASSVTISEGTPDVPENPNNNNGTGESSEEDFEATDMTPVDMSAVTIAFETDEGNGSFDYSNGVIQDIHHSISFEDIGIEHEGEEDDGHGHGEHVARIMRREVDADESISNDGMYTHEIQVTLDQGTFAGVNVITLNGSADSEIITIAAPHGYEGLQTIIFAGAGDDFIGHLNGTKTHDTIHGGAGNDTLMGNWGNDVLNGDEGNDTLRGWIGNDQMNGGAGDDIIYGGDDGQDVINGGAGNDTIVFEQGVFSNASAYSDYIVVNNGDGSITVVNKKDWGGSLETAQNYDIIRDAESYQFYNENGQLVTFTHDEMLAMAIDSDVFLNNEPDNDSPPTDDGDEDDGSDNPPADDGDEEEGDDNDSPPTDDGDEDDGSDNPPDDDGDEDEDDGDDEDEGGDNPPDDDGDDDGDGDGDGDGDEDEGGDNPPDDDGDEDEGGDNPPDDDGDEDEDEGGDNPPDDDGDEDEDEGGDNPPADDGDEDEGDEDDNIPDGGDCFPNPDTTGPVVPNTPDPSKEFVINFLWGNQSYHYIADRKNSSIVTTMSLGYDRNPADVVAVVERYGQSIDVILDAKNAPDVMELNASGKHNEINISGNKHVETDIIINSGEGHDEIMVAGISGDVIVNSGGGHDIIYTSVGDDTIVAGSGHDVVYAGSGNDNITGGEGHDRLYGQAGDDVILGGKGHDTLMGGAGDDVLNGGSGNDVVNGGSGMNILIGGSGADTFVIGMDALSIDSMNTIMDFNIMQGDALDISTMLSEYDALDDLISEFVQLTTLDGNVTVAIDVDGGGDNFVNVAVLNSIDHVDMNQWINDGNLIV